MEPMPAQLRDGRKLVIRHIQKDDYERVLEYFGGLGELSRKYFCPHPFDEENARMIVETSNMTDTVRLGAVADSPDGPMVAYIYYTHKPEQKYPRVGIGIVDACHGQGLGQILMAALAAEARRNHKPGLSLNVDKPNHRALRLYSKAGYRITGQSSEATHHEMVLDFAAQESPFNRRGMYLHPIDWKITHLTADTWTLNEWKLYLDLIQGAGANMLKIFIWPTQYYHPDYPETYPNRWRWEVYKEVLAYAKALNLQTHVGLACNCVPPFVYLAHADKRAEEVGYRGIELCWQRGKQEILEFSGYLIDYFAEAADGFIVWYADPGLCVCDLCVPYTPVMLDAMRTYQELVGDRAQVHHCPWWIWWMAGDDGPLSIPVTPNIREDIFGSMTPGDWTLLHDQDETSIRMARELGLDVLSVAFFMDPEGGNETNNVLPRTMFDRIEAAVARAAELGAGLLAYRLTPFTQFHSDWLFFRKQLYPDISRQQALGELAAFLGVGDEYVEALDLLDEWWAGYETGYDMSKLHAAADTFRKLVPQRPEYLTHLSEATDVMLLIAEAGLQNGWQVTDELVEAVQERMEQGPTFTSFTHQHLWAKARAYSHINQRVRWWIKALMPVAKSE